MADQPAAAPPAEKPKPAAPAPRALPGEIVFEVWDTPIPNPNPKEKKPFKRARCRNVIYPPSKQNLRGRWERNMLTGTEASSEGIESLPEVIPGMHIVINVAKHTVALVDPLSYPENAELLAELKVIKLKRDAEHIAPVEMAEHKDQSPTQMKTALWWAARMVQAKSLQVVKGTCPSIKEIEALPGKILYQVFSSSQGKVNFREDLPRSDWDEAAGAVLGAAPVEA